MIVSNSELIVIYPFSSNSQINEYDILSFEYSTKTATDLVLPIFFISLNITPFLRKGIFLPSTEILSAVYRRYTFSCLVDGLYLIKGFVSVA